MPYRSLTILQSGSSVPEEGDGRRYIQAPTPAAAKTTVTTAPILYLTAGDIRPPLRQAEFQSISDFAQAGRYPTPGVSAWGKILGVEDRLSERNQYLKDRSPSVRMTWANQLS